MKPFPSVLAHIYVYCGQVVDWLSRNWVFPHRQKSIITKAYVAPCALLLITFCGTLPPYSVGTTVVAFWTPDRIIVGADSKGRRGGELGEGELLVCKIRQVGNVFYALSGLREDPETGFDAHSIVVRAYNTPGRLIDKVNAFERLVSEPLSNVLAHIKAKYPLNFERDFGNKGGGMDIVFFGYENGRPVMITRRIGRRDYSRRRLEYPGDFPNSPFGAVYMGQHDSINRFRVANPGWQRMGLEKAMRRFIQMEIEEHPETVGPPIDILVIDNSGARWIQKKPECPEIK